MRKIKKTYIALVFLLILLTFSACIDSHSPTFSATTPSNSSQISSPNNIFPLKYTYKIIKTYPHDREAFTQGLVYEKGYLYEGTGLYGRSSIRKVDLLSGNILLNKELPPEYFGEGITVIDDKLIQLTWKNKIGLVYQKDSFSKIKEFNYNSEGWGLTFDGKNLVMSDGTSLLYFLDPQTFQTVKVVQIRDGEMLINNLNELEYINGEVYANIWQTDKIAIIDANSCKIKGWINLVGILPPQVDKSTIDVLNGIAYDHQTDRLLVTGKLWPYIFEIKLISGT